MPISVVNTTTASTLTVTIPSTTAGNCLVVCISSFNAFAQSVSGITLGGSAGNFAQAVAAGGTNAFMTIWADPACAGGQTSVVISGSNLQVDSANGGVVIYEVSGLVTSSPVDKTQSGTGNSTNWSSGATATTTQASEIWVGCANASGSIAGPSSPWTNAAPSGGFAIAGFQVVSSTGTATYAGTATSGTWAAAVVTLKGIALGPAGTVQPRATIPVPRRKPARALWQRITGQAFVKVPAPAQQPQPAPRRKPARAYVRFTPVTTVNAIPPNGTVQPQTAVPAPRRKPGRAVWRGIAVPGIYGTAPAQQYRTPPRRKLSRAFIQFTPVRTHNVLGPRTLLISLASQAGTDDYGNSFPQGILATAGTIQGPQFVGADFIINTAGAFFYSSTPAAGNLIASVTPAAGTDAFGNNFLAGSASYAATFATALNAGFVAFYGGSLAGGWGAALSSVSGDVAGNLQVNASGQLQLIGSVGVTINGSSSTGAGDNGGVTSGPSGTVNAFPAAGPNHTHAELHHHPL